METKPEATPAPTYEDLARLLEHSLMRPDLTESDVAKGVDLARRYRVASVIVRPSDVDLAANWVKGSGVKLGSVVDWPHGDLTTSVKTYAVRDLLRRGAQEIDCVLNTGKLLSRQFQYLEMELVQMAEACHQAGAILKVTIESQYLNEELRIVACRILRRANADYIATPLAQDLPLLKEYAKERLLLKAFPGKFEEAQQAREAGCVRLQSDATAAILDAWKAKLAEAAQAAPVIS